MTDTLPNCAAMTRRGTIMPGILRGVDPLGRVQIQAPGGKVYSFEPKDVLTPEEAEAYQRDLRIQRVADTYKFEVLGAGAFGMSVACSHPTDPKRSYLLSYSHGATHCTCRAFADSGGAGCKHLSAYDLTLTPKDEAKPAKPVQTYTAEEW